MLEHMKWIGRVEEGAADLSWDYFVMYALGMLAASTFACWCLIIQLQLYQMCPGWGPIRKFDSDGTEEMRINQLLMHEEANGLAHKKAKKGGGDENLAFLHGMVTHAVGEAAAHAEKLGGKQENGGSEATALETGEIRENGLYNGFQETYGTIGKCTWGYCESPNQWGEPKWDPKVGREVVVRHGFADTQWMRAHSRTWAKDEPYYMQQNGLRAPPLTLQDESAIKITNRMVIERGGY